MYERHIHVHRWLQRDGDCPWQQYYPIPALIAEIERMHGA